ncbi:class I SAM-dependent methyltransferase family protein [Streptomyces sp. NPDC004609]|uniref:class I SAM-dependent methyltransferase family protein n=1 Tax=Streptomyces sp. NPDC004609 TaxID=3364704 RepID=UPI0036B7FF16
MNRRLKNVHWATMRLLLGSVGRLSEGIGIGYRHGFDSGSMLDYVYVNQARGRLGVGRLIDRVYLNAIGWRAIRARRELLKDILRQEITDRAGAIGEPDTSGAAGAVGAVGPTGAAGAEAESGARGAAEPTDPRSSEPGSAGPEPIGNETIGAETVRTENSRSHRQGGSLGRAVPAGSAGRPGPTGPRGSRSAGRARPVAILDVASGPGRYLQDVVEEFASGTVRVECRDLDRAGLAQGERRARERGLTGITYSPGDALDPRPGDPAPDVIVVSGLYELLLDDSVIAASIARLRNMLAPGGVLVFTTQTRHPQLEFIAHVLPNRDGALWVMKCRSVEQAERWATDAGFTRVASRRESVGLFTVTTARN